MVERWQNSLPNMTDRAAERRRIRIVRRICVALDEVERTYGISNMRGLEGGLVAVIHGAGKEVRRIADDLLYRAAARSLREKIAAAHAHVRALLLEAWDEGLLPLESENEPKH